MFTMQKQMRQGPGLGEETPPKRIHPSWSDQIPETDWGKYKEGLLYCLHHVINRSIILVLHEADSEVGLLKEVIWGEIRIKIKGTSRHNRGVKELIKDAACCLDGFGIVS